MTNDSCNMFFDTNHFWLLGTPDNLERAEARREGESLENEQLWLLTNNSPLLRGWQHYVLITKQVILKLRQICGRGWVRVVVCLLSLHPKQPSKCFRFGKKWQTFTQKGPHMSTCAYVLFILPRSLDIYYHHPPQRRERNPRESQHLAKVLNVFLLDLGLEFWSLRFKVSTVHTGAHCSALRGSSKAVKFFQNASVLWPHSLHCGWKLGIEREHVHWCEVGLSGKWRGWAGWS